MLNLCLNVIPTWIFLQTLRGYRTRQRVIDHVSKVNHLPHLLCILGSGVNSGCYFSLIILFKQSACTLGSIENGALGNWDMTEIGYIMSNIGMGCGLLLTG